MTAAGWRSKIESEIRAIVDREPQAWDAEP